MQGLISAGVPVNDSGEELQGIYADHLAYIHAHTDSFDIARSLVSKLQILFSPRARKDGRESKHLQE